MLQVPPLNLPISIHAPRTGSDGPPGRTTALRSDFNPRSPHGERRCVPIKRRQAITFQSTLPARGATLPHPRHTKLHPHFNPRSPHGERRGRGDLDAVFIVISIHAPRTGSDVAFLRFGHVEVFQSTLPARGATTKQAPAGSCKQFQSTLPARGATSTKIFVMRWKQFQSTLPARGATSAVIRSRVRTWISIHAPRTGSDDSFHLGFTAQGISIHAPRTGSDWALDLAHQRLHDFNPRSPHGERHNRVILWYYICVFQSTLPARGATGSTWTLRR